MQAAPPCFRLSSAIWLCTIVLPGLAWAAESVAAPVQKAVTLLEDLKAEIAAEGKEATAVFREETELCKTRAGELSYSIKRAKKKIEDLSALIEKESARIEAFSEEALKLNDGIAENEDELEKALKVRANESADFQATEKELAGTVDAISRASGIIEKEMNKGTSLAQLGGARDIAEALETMVQAFAVKTAEAGFALNCAKRGASTSAGRVLVSWEYKQLGNKEWLPLLMADEAPTTTTTTSSTTSTTSTTTTTTEADEDDNSTEEESEVVPPPPRVPKVRPPMPRKNPILRDLAVQPNVVRLAPHTFWPGSARWFTLQPATDGISNRSRCNTPDLWCCAGGCCVPKREIQRSGADEASAQGPRGCRGCKAKASS